MNIEEVLILLDNWVREKKREGLTPVQKEILRRAWDDQTYDDMEIYPYSNESIKKMLAPKLWKLLSEVLGQPVTKKTLRIVVEAAVEERSPSPPPQLPIAKAPQRQDWGDAPDIFTFYDRTSELTTLDGWIVTQRCRLVALWGVAGIGKTALAVKLAQQLQGKFEFVIWRSLRYAPPVEDILADLLEFFSEEAETILPDTFANRVSLLMECLRSHRCLIILDGVETILEASQLAGKAPENYRNYGRLFKQIGESKHASCLVLTSCEKFREISLLEGQDRPVRYYKLKGLKKDAAKEILRERGLVEEPEWSSLIDRYEGNPLYLNIVAAMIRELFAGRASEYLRKNTIFIGGIEDILDPQFDKLAKVEREVVYQLAIAPNSLSFDQLQERIISQISTSKFIETVKSLEERSLIEKLIENGQAMFTLQAVVRKYILSRCDSTSN
ncbi:MAG: NACHT domain-containing protein [Actinomycetota bacterium]